MDPTANLTEQLTIAREFIALRDGADDGGIPEDDAIRLAELVIALHELVRQGALPRQWTRLKGANNVHPKKAPCVLRRY